MAIVQLSAPALDQMLMVRAVLVTNQGCSYTLILAWPGLTEWGAARLDLGSVLIHHFQAGASLPVKFNYYSSRVQELSKLHLVFSFPSFAPDLLLLPNTSHLPSTHLATPISVATFCHYNFRRPLLVFSHLNKPDYNWHRWLTRSSLN